MCGIAGILDLTLAPVSPDEILDMSAVITHRGPDDEGYCFINQTTTEFREYAGEDSTTSKKNLVSVLTRGTQSFGNLALAHRRFSIIDLSAAGHQPFIDREQSHILVFNGEIYNYPELKSELQSLGVKFQTNSDTEVFLEAYKMWREKAFTRFNGFWAAAIFVRDKNQIILSRDRLGKKPLYWSKTGNRIYFASEIKSLLKIPRINRSKQVNEAAAYQWLVYGRKDYDTETMFAGIHSFPAASWAVLNEQFPNNICQFWKLPEIRQSESEIPIKQAISEMQQILEDAVSIRLRADVPVAVELSGGMDSSAIAALASRNLDTKLTSYTVRFADPKWNEEPYARAIAQKLELNYKVLDPHLSCFWENIYSFTHLEEEPYHAPNLYTNQLIWSQMRENGTKVSLNGAGGDEIFAGYGNYYSAAQWELISKGRISDFLKNALNHTESSNAISALTRPFAKFMWKSLEENFLIPFAGKNQKALKNLPRQASVFKPTDLLSKAMYTDMTRTLMPYWLASGDRGYMGIPLEVREPFLDYRVVEYAYQLPVNYLVRDGWHKWILRKALEDLLPTEVLWRKNKLGFPFPYQRFRQENHEIFSLILEKSNNPFINFQQAENIANNWRIVSFILWYEFFFNENFSLFHTIENMASGNTDIPTQLFSPEYTKSLAAG